MTIELDDNSYIVGIWFSSNPNNNNDWLGFVIHDPKKPGCFKGWLRFRYSKSGKIFDNDDEKSWTTFYSREGDTEQTMIDFMTMVQKQIEPVFPVIDHVMVRGTPKELIKLSDTKDWLNMKQMKA